MLDGKDTLGKGKGTVSASNDKASKRAVDAGLDTRWLTLDGASKVDLVADFRSAKAQEKEGGASVSAGPSEASDKVRYEMPEGVQLIGSEASFEEQEDGSQVLTALK